MHNTGRALATQWDALLGYYCQAWGWHQKTADAVGRMPAGYLVSSQLRGFSGEQVLSAMHRPFPSTTLSLTPLGLQPEVNAWSGVLSSNKKKKLKQTDNPQVGPVYPKVKEQAKANSLFSLQSSPRVRTREDNNRLWASLSNHSFMAGEWWHGG